MPTQQEITTSVVSDILSGNLASAEKGIDTLLSIKTHELTQSQREHVSNAFLNKAEVE